LPGAGTSRARATAETNREAVANAARWQKEADAELVAWQARYDAAYQQLRHQKVKVA